MPNHQNQNQNQNQNPTILIVDDEAGIRQLVSRFLNKYHFQVLEADSAQTLFSLLKNSNPAQSIDLILLDLMLPDMHGLDICKEIRKTSKIPIIMLTASSGEMNMVLGFEAGADDYVEKPFSFHVLLSRIQALLRRINSPYSSSQGLLNPSEKNEQIETATKTIEETGLFKSPNLFKFKQAEFDCWIYHPNDGVLIHQTSHHSVLLTKNESILLNLFLIHHEKPISRERLSEALNLPIEDIESRAVDVQISRLRNKIRNPANADKNNLIQSVRNKGYALISPVKFLSD